MFRDPAWRRYSSYPPSKTATRGLGLNCSETEETSCRRPFALRKARRKRPLCVRMRRNFDHLERMIDQERMLKNSRMMRTSLATGPVWATKFPRSVAKPNKAGEYVMYASLKGNKPLLCKAKTIRSLRILEVHAPVSHHGVTENENGEPSCSFLRSKSSGTP